MKSVDTSIQKIIYFPELVTIFSALNLNIIKIHPVPGLEIHFLRSFLFPL